MSDETPPAVEKTEKAEKKAEPKIDAAAFIESPAHAVGVSGLLADEPELRDSKLTRGQWERKLAAFLNSPRP